MTLIDRPVRIEDQDRAGEPSRFLLETGKKLGAPPHTSVPRRRKATTYQDTARHRVYNALHNKCC